MIHGERRHLLRIRVPQPEMERALSIYEVVRNSLQENICIYIYYICVLRHEASGNFENYIFLGKSENEMKVKGGR